MQQFQQQMATMQQQFKARQMQVVANATAASKARRVQDVAAAAAATEKQYRHQMMRMQQQVDSQRPREEAVMSELVLLRQKQVSDDPMREEKAVPLHELLATVHNFEELILNTIALFK